MSKEISEQQVGEIVGRVDQLVASFAVAMHLTSDKDPKVEMVARTVTVSRLFVALGHVIGVREAVRVMQAEMMHPDKELAALFKLEEQSPCDHRPGESGKSCSFEHMNSAKPAPAPDVN